MAPQGDGFVLKRMSELIAINVLTVNTSTCVVKSCMTAVYGTSLKYHSSQDIRYFLVLGSCKTCSSHSGTSARDQD